MTRGEYITKLRKENNLTQDEVAEKLYIDRSTLSKYEHDASEMNLDTMEKLSKIYHDKVINIIYGNPDAYKNIENNIEKLHFDKYSAELNSLKLKKKLLRNRLISVIFIILLLLSFFVYYFINTYNSIKIYKLNSNDSSIFINNSLIVLTNQEMYLNIPNIKVNGEIKYVELV